MRRLSGFLLSIPLLLSACSKDTPVEPTNSANPPPSSSVVIGPGGGTLSADGFSIVIPASALSSPETLSVTQDSYDNCFGPANASKVYRLEGLPSSCSGTLRISVKCQGPTSGGLFIAVGREGTTPILGEPSRVYTFLPALLDSGFLKSTIVPGTQESPVGKTGGGRGDPSEVIFWFMGLNDIDTLRSSGNHFFMHYRRDLAAPARIFLQTLEEIYSGYANAGFGYHTYRKLHWPVGVSFQKGAGLAGSLVRGEYDIIDPAFQKEGSFRIWCNEDRLTASPYGEYRKWLACTFGVAISFVYENFWVIPHDPANYLTQGARVWPYMSIVNWASTHTISTGSDSIPPDLVGNRLVPLFGVPPPNEGVWKVHGGAMAPLMHHLADVYGVSTLVDIFHALPTSARGVDALLEKVPEPENVWWPAFLRRYLSGEIYGVSADTLLQEMQTAPGTREFTVAGKGDTERHFSAQYRDLSVKLYRVNLRYPDFPPTSTMTFAIGPGVNMNYVHVMLFGLKNHKLEYWGTGNTLTVTKLYDLTAGGYDIVAAVINSANEPPYTATMGIDLDVTISSEIPGLARIRVRTSGATTYSDGSTYPTSSVQYNSGQVFRRGTLLNGVFTARWDTALSAGVNSAGSWTIQFDFSTIPSRVTYFKAEEKITSFDTETWKVEASATCNITGGKDQYGRYFYRVQGTDVARHILPVYDRMDGSSGYWWELTSTSFNENSFIEIILE